ncbi:hypothetical protein DH2020_049633 [Rehmannia glutinosa]|uniref:Protein kinase domain-containing protein n=1 Tax=Rehmannia glutinosa TaxID=99300 RepID=A0ABR0U2C4_REHGL
MAGELQQVVGNLVVLEIFSVFNNSLFGSIPSSIFNISTLKSLDLSSNQFSGSLHLPWKLSLFNDLEELYLHTNQLSGEIPSSITNASKLTVLELSYNSFSGFVPNFGNLRLLRWFTISKNNLTGSTNFLSSLTDCRNLELLTISGNPLHGILPPSIGNLSSSLESFWAADCNITGVIPHGIGNLSSLLDLVLDRNQLTGFIPPTIGKLKQLQVLYLNGNKLQGYISPNICELSNMGNLYLADNILTGPIPECLGEVKSLRIIYLGSNKLNSTIPSNLWNLKDLIYLDLSFNYLSGQLSSQIASLKALNGLDLSSNQLSGNITSSIGSCQSLEFLSLSINKFEGSIPPSLGNMRGLSTLDLSSNNLSGLIPKSLENLRFLQYFNVSYNKLEGEIPTDGSFVNFTAQSFVNNFALCGATKYRVPHCVDKKTRRSRRKNVVRLMKYILPTFIFVIILATVFILVLMRRRKLKRLSAPADDIPLGISWRRISYIELVRGTCGFSEANLLGKGSFGSVFKGTLSDGLNVAVKVFNLELERAVRSFDTECEILSTIRHRNLVRILGCCTNIEFKALILGYMSNGSLEKWLYSENYCLDLIQRLKIAIDVALALEYLHHGHTFSVVHCDIKPNNVLLDEDMTAHLGDFGIAKLFGEGETTVQTKTLGTIGYAAPEYGSEGKVSPNGDVYSYGILLLEMFTGKKPTDDMFNEEMGLKDCVHEALQENAVSEIVAPGLLAREDQYFSAKEECVSSIFSLGMKCLVISCDERINMMQTVAALQRIKAKVVASTTRRQRYALSNITRGQ